MTEATVGRINRGIERINQRISELEKIDLSTITIDQSPTIQACQAAIQDTLERCFGAGSSAYTRFIKASHLEPKLTAGRPESWYQERVTSYVHASIALLNEARRSLVEDLADYHDLERFATVSEPGLESFSKRIFIVHGHDDAAREKVARFLLQVGLEPVILHEQANRGGTVIEKIEANSDVGFAVVLLTPDDFGGANGNAPEPRVRQNVLLELGYFLRHLGRKRVCVLKSGAVEIPSDFAGVVWEPMDGNGWKLALGRELDVAGYDIDFNKIMRS